jgi:hypothetical protein
MQAQLLLMQQMTALRQAAGMGATAPGMPGMCVANTCH